MPQLSLYLDEPTMEMLREKSSRAHQSMSRYVTRLIREVNVSPKKALYVKGAAGRRATGITSTAV